MLGEAQCSGAGPRTLSFRYGRSPFYFFRNGLCLLLEGSKFCAAAN